MLCYFHLVKLDLTCLQYLCYHAKKYLCYLLSCFGTHTPYPVFSQSWIISCSNVEGKGYMELEIWERACWHYERPREHPNVQGSEWWTGDGWRSISEKFNQMFPFAHFTKQQLQEKEKELKGSWKAIHVARQESGVGWNDSLAMVIAEPEKWKKLTSVRIFHGTKKLLPYSGCKH